MVYIRYLDPVFTGKKKYICFKIQIVDIFISITVIVNSKVNRRILPFQGNSNRINRFTECFTATYIKITTYPWNAGKRQCGCACCLYGLVILENKITNTLYINIYL